MPAIETILLFFVADLAICLVPGPATAITASYAASGGMRAALGPIAGIHAANFIWYALSAFGLAALVTTAPDLYALIRWLGVGYLLWMGWRMMSSAGREAKIEKQRQTGFWTGFGSGLAVHMSNPKAMLFYVSFLPQFIDPQLSISVQIVVFAAVTLITESIGLLTYSFAAASAQKLVVKRLGQWSVDRIAGSVLIIVAIVMAVLNSLQ